MVDTNISLNNIWGLKESSFLDFSDRLEGDDEMETDIKEGIKDLAKGYIRFSIKADDTEENRKIHEDFKDYCKGECDNNYTLGLKSLMDYIKDDVKIQMLYEIIQELKTRVAVLESEKTVSSEDKEENKKVF